MGRSTQASPSSRRDAPRRASKEDESADPVPSDEVSDVLARTSLSLAGHALPPPAAVAQTLARFMQLRRLDVSNMQASDDAPSGLTDLHWLAKAERLSKKQARDGATPLSQRLTWLNVANNEALGSRDDDVNGLELMTALNGTLRDSRSVECVALCAQGFPPAISALRGLKALVLSHNHLSALPAAFPHLPELNTLVLSNNELTQLPITLPSSLPSLKKLSLGHNRLECGGLPDLSVCANLREVRLGGNRSLRALPAHLPSWGRGVDGGAPGLVLLDVSDCGLDAWEAVKPLVTMPQQTERHGLANLVAKDNGIADQTEYREKLCDALPALRILDNVRLFPKKSAPPVSDAQGPATEPAPAPQDNEESTLAKATVKQAKAPAARAKRARDEPPPPAPRDPFFVPRDAGPTAPASSKRRKAGKPPVPAPDVAEPKKVRKRSGRGPKRRATAPSEAPAPESAPVPADPAPAPSEPAPAPSEPAPTKTKKTRRKKSTKAVELDMDAPVAEPPKVPAPSARAPSPPPAARADTGVVQIVNVAPSQRTATPAATLLGRRDDELGGW